MIKKRNKFIFAQLCLYFTILISTCQVTALNFTQLARTTRTACTLIKKLAKVGAVLGGAYLLANKLLGHLILPNNPETHSFKQIIKRLVVVTDGKVTIRKSKDDTSTIIHKFGTSRRSDLPQINTGHYFDPSNEGTLFVQGCLKECRPSKFQRFIEWFFRVTPKRALEHIIEVPENVDVEITTANSDRYTHNKEEPVVSIDSIKGQITVHAASGDVEINNTEESAKLEASKLPPASLNAAPAAPTIASTNPSTASASSSGASSSYSDITPAGQSAAPTSTATSSTNSCIIRDRRENENLYNAKATGLKNLHIYTVKGEVRMASLKPQEENPEERPDRHIARWDKKTDYKTATIYTHGRVIATGLQGELHVHGTENVQVERARQSHTGKLFINGIEQATFGIPQPCLHGNKEIVPEYLRKCSRLTAIEPWTAEEIQPFLGYWTEAQLAVLKRHWTLEQLADVTRHFRPEQLQGWTPERLQYWTPEQLEYCTLEELQRLKLDHLQHWTAALPTILQQRLAQPNLAPTVRPQQGLPEHSASTEQIIP